MRPVRRFGRLCQISDCRRSPNVCFRTPPRLTPWLCPQSGSAIARRKAFGGPLTVDRCHAGAARPAGSRYSNCLNHETLTAVWRPWEIYRRPTRDKHRGRFRHSRIPRSVARRGHQARVWLTCGGMRPGSLDSEPTMILLSGYRSEDSARSRNPPLRARRCIQK